MPERTLSRRPSISILVAVRNCEKFLKGCLDSLLDQTVLDSIEIIVIDGNSSEHEKNIVLEYRRKFPHIKYIFTKKLGLYHAWNLGIKASRGKYITNLNSDDRLSKNALAVMKKTLDDNPDAALVYGDSYITRKPNETFTRNSSRGLTTRWPDHSRKQLLLHCICGPHPMWRKRIHKMLGFFDEKYVSAGDYEFWLRISEKYKMLHIPKVIGLYYRNTQGISILNKNIARKESLNMKLKYLRLK